MKQVLFALCAIIGTVMIGQSANAQAKSTSTATANKIAFFSSDEIVRYMPEYQKMNPDSLVDIYTKDSINPQYEIVNSEFKRLDSTYKADSATGKASPSKLKYLQDERNKNLYTLIQWQQIAQNAQQAYYGHLVQPLYVKIETALKKVCAEKKVGLVLKPTAIEYLPTNSAIVENINLLVAKELKIPLNENAGNTAK